MDSWRSRLNALAAALTLILVIAIWIALAPPQFGGQTIFVIVNGNSMEPTLHRGDLVLLRQADSYTIGDIATYRHPDLGLVIHRIVGEANGRFALKGDNNAWLDSYHPTQAEMIGKFWTFVPSAGRMVDQLRRPWPMALFAGLLTAVLSVSAVIPVSRPQAKRRRRPTTSGNQIAMNQTAHSTQTDLLFVIAVIAVASLMLGLFAFTRPLTRQVFDEITYTHSGAFSYTAVAPPGLYDGNLVKTGEPVFRRLINRVSVAFDYRLQAEAISEVVGTARLDAVLTSNNGWQRTFELAGERSFQGDRVRISGELDLARIQAVLDSVEQQTGVASTQYRLALVPTVVVRGVLAGQAWQETFAPQLAFLLDPRQMQLAANRNQAGETSDPLKPTERKTLRQAHTVPNTLSLLNLSLPVSVARILSAAGLALALLASIGLALAAALRGRRDEAAQIEARFGALLVNVCESDLLAGQRLVQVARIDDLARIAERGGRMILHEATGDGHRYLVQDEDVVYFYRSAGAALSVSATEGGR